MKKRSNLKLIYERSDSLDNQKRITHAFNLIFSKIPHKGCNCGWTSVGEILAEHYSKNKEENGK